MTLNMIWISKFCGGYVGIFIAAFGDKLLNTKSSLIIPCPYLIGPFENVISAIDQTLCVRPDLRVQSANNPRLRNLFPTMLLLFIRAKQIIHCKQRFCGTRVSTSVRISVRDSVCIMTDYRTPIRGFTAGLIPSKVSKFQFFRPVDPWFPNKKFKLWSHTSYLMLTKKISKLLHFKILAIKTLITYLVKLAKEFGKINKQMNVLHILMVF